jgi:hypothetical protein
MATFKKDCDSPDCVGVSCNQTCPEGWFCAFGENFSPELAETECLTGVCVRYPRDQGNSGTPQVLPGSQCQRCDQGYVIIQWEDSYISDTGEGDCEYVSDCPEACTDYLAVAFVGECTDASSCPKAGCGALVECPSGTFDPNYDTTYDCPDSQTKQECELGGGMHCWGSTIQECISGRGKTGEAKLKCCGCLGCDPDPCVSTNRF